MLFLAETITNCEYITKSETVFFFFLFNIVFQVITFFFKHAFTRFSANTNQKCQ